MSRGKKTKKDLLKSKYSSLDIQGMSNEEFQKIARGVYISIAVRSVLGILLFIVGIIGLILGGIYFW